MNSVNFPQLVPCPEPQTKRMSTLRAYWESKFPSLSKTTKSVAPNLIASSLLRSEVEIATTFLHCLALAHWI
jgi:hypothetical protein